MSGEKATRAARDPALAAMRSALSAACVMSEGSAERGLKAGQIALRLDRKSRTINFAMHRLGLVQPVERQFDYMRGGRRVRSFSPEEDAWISARRREGHTVTRIAARHHQQFGFQRAVGSIRVRLLMLANRDDATAEQRRATSTSQGQD